MCDFTNLILKISITPKDHKGDHFKLRKKPNKLTKKVLKESGRGENVKTFESLDDFFHDLGI